jgi:homoserine kinase
VPDAFTVSVPASSANIGPGFDALGLALALPLELTVGNVPGPTDERHLAIRSFRAAGGTGEASVTARFPGGRGLGFSGAARVAGTMAAAVQRGADEAAAREHARHEATEMEGHGDNVGASVLGGLVAVAGDHAVRVPIARECVVVVWIPDAETSTKASRSQLPESVPFGDAVFSIGRVALLVAALATGDIDALRTATEDRLHQDRRLELVPRSRAVLSTVLDVGAWCGWLSGSGPSVAALCPPAASSAIEAALPHDDARVLTVAIDNDGARLTRREPTT